MLKSDKSNYDHKAVEKKWQAAWKLMKIDQMDLSRAGKRFYNLMMFPYPSAEGLHVGNMYAFTGSDIYGRYKRMQGYEVFEPIGLDGFGIHSENYALKVGRHPLDHARITQQNYYNQLYKIGAMFDWSRTVETYNPDYYRWTQWLFVQMFKNGLAYRAKAQVNWCLSCKTVLADEQVIDEKCERCGNMVEKRALEQWFFRITAYAEKLLENSFSLDWSEKVKVAQQNWIGKKTGINITYPVYTADKKKVGEVICFTTRPDTNFGATFVAVAPEHPFVSQMLRVTDRKHADQINHYVMQVKRMTEENRVAQGRVKTGVATGLYSLNQLTDKLLPIYVSDFVLMGFGTGAVIGVPGHDLRDFEFAQSMKLPIERVVVGLDGDKSSITRPEQVQEEAGTMINSDFLNGLEIKQAINKMIDYLEKKGWGKRVSTYHLRDWLISRQRYWGPPIPMIYCEKCAKAGKSELNSRTAEVVHANLDASLSWDSSGWYSVPEDELPVILPNISDYKPGNDGVAPLAKHKEFYETKCPGCGGPAVRETDVSDTFLDSSWYFLRYPSVVSKDSRVDENFLDPLLASQSAIESDTAKLGKRSAKILSTHSSEVQLTARSSQFPWDPEITKKWLPVDMYTGGAEHSVLHLMYSRFVAMALKDWGYIDFEEPFVKFFAHGLVIKDGAKMSKSKGNVINPDEYIETYGADSLRLYLMFMGPFSQGGDFRDTAMEGMSRWVGRIWRMTTASLEKLEQLDKLDELVKFKIKQSLNQLIAKVSDDLEKRRYNTAIASMMEWTNLVADKGGVAHKAELKQFVLLLAPFAPHFAEELWQVLGGKNSVHLQSWPQADRSALRTGSVTVVVQIDSRLRDTIALSEAQAKDQQEVEAVVKRSEKVQRFLAAAQVKRIVFVPGKLINFVTG